MAATESVGHTQNCEQHYDIDVKTSAQQQAGDVAGLAWMRWNIQFFTWTHTHTFRHTHIWHVNMQSCSFQQSAVVFCKTSPASLPSLWTQHIPSNWAEMWMETDPVFTVQGEAGRGPGKTLSTWKHRLFKTTFFLINTALGSGSIVVYHGIKIWFKNYDIVLVMWSDVAIFHKTALKTET